MQTDQGTLTCRLRGKLKKGRLRGDVAAVGDRVLVTPIDEQTGVIDQVEPRLRVFSRKDPNPSGVYEQVLIANPDQVAIVFACAMPAPRLPMLDRFLVIAERQSVPALIIANKVDLIGLEAAQEIFGHYPPLGYKVLYTSASTGMNIDELQHRLVGILTLFTGPSGVGKSSLLNAIQPGLGLHAREVSQATTKGRHTTVVRELFPLEGGGYVADTPGLKALALFDIEAEELDAYFPEIRALVPECAFNDCTHDHEPGCAVRRAVAEGLIHPERYESYLKIRLGEME